jgi:hypothetical protein
MDLLFADDANGGSENANGISVMVYLASRDGVPGQQKWPISVRINTCALCHTCDRLNELS